MNVHQQIAKKRLARRFSSGDGVRLTSGTEKGERGHIVAIGACALDTRKDVHQYTIVLTSKEGVVSGNESEFESCPAANVGKYGGPSRGGSRERGNNYGYRARR